MAFHLINMPGLLEKRKTKQAILYHSRSDRELNLNFSNVSLDFDDLVTEDWQAFRQKVIWQDWISYKYQDINKNLLLSDRLKIFKELIRESKNQGLKPASDCLNFILWQYFHPRTNQFNLHYNPLMHRRTWGFLRAGIEQLKNYRLIITNRLHGHILCVILKIPHVFLANSYYKNQAFYETWTYQLPFCKFVKEASHLQNAVRELREAFPD
jgi:exopolysaccharide biosynthesis predicted pyruvyltransferase EpsI